VARDDDRIERRGRRIALRLRDRRESAGAEQDQDAVGRHRLAERTCSIIAHHAQPAVDIVSRHVPGVGGTRDGGDCLRPNEGSATISVIDTATDKVTDTLRFGKKPRGIAISRTARACICPIRPDALVVVDTAKREIVATVPLGESPEAIYLSPDGKWLSVAIEENDSVAIVDTTSLKVDRRIKMKGKNPEHAVWSPDGKWLYVSAEEADSVDIVDVAKGEVVKSVKVGDRPRGIGFLPDGTRAYVPPRTRTR
jgi:YVTN family beta-propeller protein